MTASQRIALVVGSLGLAAALGVVAYWGRGPSPGHADAFPVTRPPRTETRAFELPDLAGGRVRLGDFQGRVVLLNFWATWCEPCREEMPALQTLATELGPAGLVVLAVSYKEAQTVVSPFVREVGLRFPVLLDRDGAVAAAYQVFALPTTALVDRRGRHVGTVLGIRDWTGPAARAYLRQLLDAPAS